LRPVTGRFTPRITSDPACLGRLKVVVQVVVTAALLTGWSSARCCCAFIACHCASVGFAGLLWLTQVL
jgi:hypothetical protein